MSPARAAAFVAATLAATALTGCSLTSVKDEPVSLSGVRDAYVSSGAAERPAVEGATLKKGDEVRTGRNGAVTLVVRERRVTLGGATSVTVPDGATLELDNGALLVDRRRGPGLTLVAGDTTVDNVGSGALRVEKSFTVLVAALSAGARVRTATGQRLGLDPLYQVVVPGRALPRAPLPLHLRADDWERAVIPAVVADDERLNVLAADLDGPGGQVVPASFRPPNGGKASDLVLAEAIARAAVRDERARAGAARRAVSLRADGGSWGVIARILNTDAAGAAAALGDVLKGVPASTQPEPSPTPGTVAGRSPQPGVTPSPSAGRPTKTPDPGTPTTPPPTTSTPTQTPGPVDELLSALPTPLLPPDLLP